MQLSWKREKMKILIQGEEERQYSHAYISYDDSSRIALGELVRGQRQLLAS